MSPPLYSRAESIIEKCSWLLSSNFGNIESTPQLCNRILESIRILRRIQIPALSGNPSVNLIFNSKTGHIWKCCRVTRPISELKIKFSLNFLLNVSIRGAIQQTSENPSEHPSQNPSEYTTKRGIFIIRKPIESGLFWQYCKYPFFVVYSRDFSGGFSEGFSEGFSVVY